MRSADIPVQRQSRFPLFLGVCGLPAQWKCSALGTTPGFSNTLWWSSWAQNPRAVFQSQLLAQWVWWGLTRNVLLHLQRWKEHLIVEIVSLNPTGNALRHCSLFLPSSGKQRKRTEAMEPHISQAPNSASRSCILWSWLLSQAGQLAKGKDW